MWRDIAFRICLCFLAMTPSAGGGGRPQILVQYSESVSVIQAAFCPADPSHRNEHIYSVSLRQGQKELERVTTLKRPHTAPTVLKLARRGRLPAAANRPLLVVAAEPSVSFSLEDDALDCLTHYVTSSNATVTATVRSYQALKRSWTVEKLRATPDSVLEIEVMDEGMGWRSVFPQDGWTSSHRGATSSVRFYNSAAESDDMTILKVVDTADVFSLTVLVSQNSTLPADSGKWRYRVRVGGVVKDSQWASLNQTQLSPCKTKGPADLTGIVVPRSALIAIGVVVFVLIVLAALGLIIHCRRSRTSDRARRLPLEANHYETIALDNKEDHEESYKQDYQNAVMLPSSS